ncbi:MAG TPA: hypothetical protein VIG24_14730 [Acidimicrobiia bacterium]
MIPQRPGTSQWLYRVVAIAVGLLAIVYFYRGFFQSGFALVQGNFFDGRLTLTFSQHWANPWQFGSPTDIGIFYPLSQGLMYSDTFLAQGIMSAPLIWLGVDASITFQITLMLMSFIGYLCTVAIFRLFGSPWLVAVTAGLLANFSNGMLVASAHPQLITLSLFPAALLLLVLSARSARTSHQLVLAATAGAVYGLILYSAFYIGWMLALGLFIAIVVWLLASPGVARRSVLEYFSWSRLLAFAAGFVPFALLTLFTYLPLLRSGIVRELDDVAAFAPTPRDLLGVSPTNAVWSLPFSHLLGTLRDEEFAMAPTPLLLLISFLLLIWGIRRRSPSPLVGIGVGATGAGLLLWLLPIKWGSVFPWAVIYQIPGASAMRAIGRIEIIAGFFLVFGIALLATVLLRSFATRRALWVSAVIAALLLVEQLNTRIEQKVDVADVAALRELPAPTLQCNSFFIAPPLDTRRIYANQADPVIDAGIALGITAQIIARSQGIPSLNGYSGGEPLNWPLGPATLIDYPRYEAELKRYVEAFELTDVCGLNLQDGTWFRYPPIND